MRTLRTLLIFLACGLIARISQQIYLDEHRPAPPPPTITSAACTDRQLRWLDTHPQAPATAATAHLLADLCH